MWFDFLMDDGKAVFELSRQYKGVFVPVFLKLIMTLIIGVYAVISIGITAISGALSGIGSARDIEVIISILAPMFIFLVFGYIIFMIFWALIEVGSINLYRAAINGEKPTREHFLTGIKRYMMRVFGGKLFIHFLVLILSPLLIIFFVIYAVILGIPTAGWAVVFLTVVIGAYFATWTIAIVNDDLGVFKGLGASFRLAKRHFKPMFILVLSMMMVVRYSSWILGPLAFVFLGWFLGGVVRTFFRIVLYKTYLRYEEKVQYP
ncbi:hypothetical protein SAMN02745751_00187 [Dethiosulfatibacter aminovorans DSM 17477]|uniref:Uncharacterized protein n=1 Tax=Dethiosulfatibacter aminovorans DSM 17477 TaxID=1121476 RepID=A0A1M6ANF3_9FIRM|nr:hypothetical protein [Dethiosulfatibacter aminovorans]SHI37961.1 hypothetical protein SAMN02745751_00187 [Dethiosulfatibacter aminovorans DSM 17477]